MRQKKVFVTAEGDRYFERNRAKLNAHESMVDGDLVLDAVAELELRPTSVIEVGCSNGWRLAELQRRYGAEVHGVDPSASAVAEGTAHYPSIHLQQGTADRLEHVDGKFDLLIYGFCLYLCDREDMFRIAAEGDRVLADGGHMVIFDFLPPQPFRNSYSHSPGVYCYKMDYARMFLWDPAYTQVLQRVTTHTGMAAIADPNERIAVSVLRKGAETAYPDGLYQTAR